MHRLDWQINLELIMQNIKLESGVQILFLVLSTSSVKGIPYSKIVNLRKIGVI